MLCEEEINVLFQGFLRNELWILVARLFAIIDRFFQQTAADEFCWEGCESVVCPQVFAVFASGVFLP